jgi:hypothetical protein
VSAISDVGQAALQLNGPSPDIGATVKQDHYCANIGIANLKNKRVPTLGVPQAQEATPLWLIIREVIPVFPAAANRCKGVSI